MTQGKIEHAKIQPLNHLLRFSKHIDAFKTNFKSKKLQYQIIAHKKRQISLPLNQKMNFKSL